MDAELSFLEALARGWVPGESPAFSFEEKQAIGSDIRHYYRLCNDLSRPVMLRNGEEVARIAQTNYWLVENDDTFIGQISLRGSELPPHLQELGGHIGYSIRPDMRRKGYATAMLELLLRKVDKQEYNPVLITCNEDNYPSRRVIENNGGVLQDIIETKYNPDYKTCRYHIFL